MKIYAAGVQPLWDQVIGHFLEVISVIKHFDLVVQAFLNSTNVTKIFLQLVNCSNQQLRNIALDALDQSINAVLGSDRFQESLPSGWDASEGVSCYFFFFSFTGW